MYKKGPHTAILGRRRGFSITGIKMPFSVFSDICIGIIIGEVVNKCLPNRAASAADAALPNSTETYVNALDAHLSEFEYPVHFRKLWMLLPSKVDKG